MLLFHPRIIRLERFAAGASSAADAPDVADHLAACPRCRRHVVFYRALADALGRLEPVPVNKELIDRVIEQRRNGRRALLPLHRGPSAVPRTRFARLAVAAAMVLCSALLLTLWTRASRRSTQPDTAVDAALLQTFILPRAAFASPRQRLQDFAPLAPRASALRGERMVYSYRHGSRDIGRGEIVLAAIDVDGTATWRVIQRWQAADTVQSETLYVDRASLGILGRTIHASPYAAYREIVVRQRVRGDSLVGWMNSPGGLGRPIARQLPRSGGPYVTDAFAPLALWGAPLSRSWRGRFSVLGWAVRTDDLYIPVTVRVVGEDEITTPAGDFDCWVLELHANGGAQRMWARKKDGVVVRLLEEGSKTAPPREIVLSVEQVNPS